MKERLKTGQKRKNSHTRAASCASHSCHAPLCMRKCLPLPHLSLALLLCVVLREKLSVAYSYAPSFLLLNPMGVFVSWIQKIIPLEQLGIIFLRIILKKCLVTSLNSWEISL